MGQAELESFTPGIKQRYSNDEVKEEPSD
jgi:hypothetical protein